MLQNKICIGLLLALCLPVLAYADHASILPAERDIRIVIMQTDSSNVLSVVGLLSVNYTEPLVKGMISDVIHAGTFESSDNPSLGIEYSAMRYKATVAGIYDFDGNDIMEYKNYMWHSTAKILTVECEKDKNVHLIEVGPADADRFYVNSTGQDKIFVNLKYDDIHKRNDGTFRVVFASLTPMYVITPEETIITDKRADICYNIEPEDMLNNIIYYDGRPNPTKYDSFEEFKKNASFGVYYYGIEFMVSPSPSTQLKNGIASEDITCYFNRNLYLNDDTPLCLTQNF